MWGNSGSNETMQSVLASLFVLIGGFRKIWTASFPPEALQGIFEVLLDLLDLRRASREVPEALWGFLRLSKVLLRLSSELSKPLLWPLSPLDRRKSPPPTGQRPLRIRYPKETMILLNALYKNKRKLFFSKYQVLVRLKKELTSIKIICDCAVAFLELTLF